MIATRARVASDTPGSVMTFASLAFATAYPERGFRFSARSRTSKNCRLIRVRGHLHGEPPTIAAMSRAMVNNATTWLKAASRCSRQPRHGIPVERGGLRHGDPLLQASRRHLESASPERSGDSPDRLLGQVTFANETASGWQTAILSAPVAIRAATNYLVSYLSPTGTFSASPTTFSLTQHSGPLTVTNGGDRFTTSGVTTFPTTSSNVGYFIDIQFDSCGQAPPIIAGLMARAEDPPVYPGSVTIGLTLRIGAAAASPPPRGLVASWYASEPSLLSSSAIWRPSHVADQFRSSQGDSSRLHALKNVRLTWARSSRHRRHVFVQSTQGSSPMPTWW